MTYKVTKCLGDSDSVIATNLKTLAEAEAIQAAFIASDKDGADFYIDGEDSNPMARMNTYTPGHKPWCMCDRCYLNAAKAGDPLIRS